VHRAGGAFYAFPSVKGVLAGHPRPSPDDERRARNLVHRRGEGGCRAGEAFGAPGYFRMSYALGDDDLEEGLTRLGALFGEGA